MKIYRFLTVAALCLPAIAAVTGTVINRSTGQPQAGATVGLNKLGGNGIELIDQAKSDAQGKFTINQNIQGPHLLRTVYDGVSYNHMLPPGSPTSNITVDVYNASKDQPAGARVSKHMLLFEPAAGKMTINETFLFNNESNTAWNDSDRGTVRFYLPEGAGGKAQVNATAPGGMPIGAAVLKTAKSDVYAVDFAIKPGETRIDVAYTVPYVRGAPYSGKIVTKDENTYLVAPNGITLKGENLTDLGAVPNSQAHVFGLTADKYKIELSGEVAAAPASDGGGSDNSGPQIEQILPRVNSKAPLILALALGILALGFAMLYRTDSKESNERGRR